MPVRMTPAAMTAPRRDEHALQQRGLGADEDLVLDDDRPAAGRLEHAADLDPGREVDARADLGARADEDVRVDHRALADPGPDVDERGRHDVTPGAR